MDMPELRMPPRSRTRLSVDVLLLCECPERPDRTEAWEGDVLRLPLEIAIESLCSLSVSGPKTSIDNGRCRGRGLSSMGGIRLVSEIRMMDARLSCPLKEELKAVPLEVEDKEFRAVGGLTSNGMVNTSLSNWSASADDISSAFLSRKSDLERSESPTSDVHSCDDASTRSGSWRYGISMLDRTSWSKSPSISISCIFARDTNLDVKQVSICT